MGVQGGRKSFACTLYVSQPVPLMGNRDFL